MCGELAGVAEVARELGVEVEPQRAQCLLDLRQDATRAAAAGAGVAEEGEPARDRRTVSARGTSDESPGIRARTPRSSASLTSGGESLRDTSQKTATSDESPGIRARTPRSSASPSSGGESLRDTSFGGY